MQYFWKYLNCLYILPQNMSSCFQRISSNTRYSKHQCWIHDTVLSEAWTFTMRIMYDLFWGNCFVHNVCSSMHTLHWQLVTWSNEWWKLPCGCSSLILTVIPRSWCFSAPAPGSHNDYHHESLRHTAPASFCSRHDILRYETLRKKECIWGQLNHDERHKINNDALPLMSVSV